MRCGLSDLGLEREAPALDLEEQTVLTEKHYWRLRFDGNCFLLGPATSLRPHAEDRALEESLETILFRWRNQLLPAPRLQMLGYSGSVTEEQDLLAVDELGRVQIFALKKDTADAVSMFHLVSYVTGCPRDDEH